MSMCSHIEKMRDKKIGRQEDLLGQRGLIPSEVPTSGTPCMICSCFQPPVSQAVWVGRC